MIATELTLLTLIWEKVFGVAEGSAVKIGKGGLGLGYVRERMNELQLHGNFYNDQDRVSFTLREDGDPESRERLWTATIIATRRSLEYL
jgi:hypothetical protein